MKHKTVSIDIIKQEENGGEIVISTGTLDRDNDHVNPLGARVDNYLKNPVVQWGHNYHDPWATIGKTTDLQISSQGLKATFELRDAVNDGDPQHIVLALWNSGLVKTASIGFNPTGNAIQENDQGGLDFNEWELLEWSLVPIPANQEALRLAVKGFDYETTASLPVVVEPKSDVIMEQLSTFIKVIREAIK